MHVHAYTHTHAHSQTHTQTHTEEGKWLNGFKAHIALKELLGRTVYIDVMFPQAPKSNLVVTSSTSPESQKNVVDPAPQLKGTKVSYFLST